MGTKGIFKGLGSSVPEGLEPKYHSFIQTKSFTIHKALTVLAQFLNIGNDDGVETQRECRRRVMKGGGITERPELGFRVILV